MEIPRKKLNFLIATQNNTIVNSPGDQGSIPGRAIPKTPKIVLDAALLIRYGSRVKWSNPRKGVAPSFTP